MTDQETFEAMLTRANAPFDTQHYRSADMILVTLDAGNGRNLGYGGFSATFVFTAAGALDHVEIWK